MKPFLGTDITLDEDNEAINGDELIVARPSSAMQKALDIESEKSFELLKSSICLKPTTVLCIIFAAVLAFTLMAMFELVTGDEGMSVAEAYDAAGWVFWLCGANAAALAVTALVAYKSEKSSSQSDEGATDSDNIDALSKQIFAELGVPSSYIDVDVFSFPYKLNNGKYLPSGEDWDNFEFRIFKDVQTLYLASLDGKYAIPLSSLKKIHTVKKKIPIFTWNKDIKPDEGEYKQYKMTKNSYYDAIIKYYHILEFEHGGELWGIYFPCYELPIFERLTGLVAEDM